MKHREVELHIKAWGTEGKQVSMDDEDHVLLCTDILVDGIEIFPPWWSLDMDGFLVLTVGITYGDRLDNLEDKDDYYERFGRDKETAMKLWSQQFAPDQWLMGSNDDQILLPVASLNIVQHDVIGDFSVRV